MTVNAKTLQGAIKDDRKAVEELYEYCFGLLMPICFRYNKNEGDSRASLNVGFVKIHKSIKDIKGKEDSFNAWARRIMTNTLIDEYRKRKRHNERYFSMESDRELDYFAENNNENEAISIMGEAVILKLIKELSAVTAQVFNMYVIDGYSHKEIADALDMAEGTSKWHLSSAKKALRGKLQQIEEKTIG
ncbi:MAG: RNA polymerase sigma factor (sigma-70 family) [Psychromonas sp.]|jgi:RNA polymerase sigma factor (sigma-70 family)